jgi:hypothetical protein
MKRNGRSVPELETTSNRSIRLGPLALLGVLFVVLVGPMVALEARRTTVPAAFQAGWPSELMDQDHYHWRVIVTMDEQWPRPNVVEYRSATSPGYHLVQTAVYRMTGSRTGILIANALFGFGLIAALYVTIAPFAGSWPASAMVLPLMLSPYTLGGSIWMTTDNLALTFVVLAIGGALLRPFSRGRAVRTGVYAALGVLVRQVHLWTAAPIAWSALQRSPLATLIPGPLRIQDDAPRTWSNLLIGGCAALMPAVLLGVFAMLWGGLLPIDDEIRAKHGAGWNPAAFAFGLSVVCVLGAAYLPLLSSTIRTMRPADPMLWGAAIIGLITALAAPTSHVKRFRDNGWIWSVVERVPEIADRTVLFLLLAPVGAVLLVLLYRAARDAGRGPIALGILLTFLGWLLAQSFNATAWQRYFEQPILIMLAMLGALFVGSGRTRFAYAGLIALGAAELLLSGITMYREFLGKVL